MSSEAQVALIVGIVSALAALVGALGATLVGWVLNRKSEIRREKRAAFVELLAAIDACQMRLVFVRVAMEAHDKTGRQREAELMLTMMNRVDIARSVAALALPSRHHETLDNAVNACLAAYTEVVRPEAKSKKPELSISDAWQTVVDLGHAELGV
jgi:hypothetical protein